MASRRYVPLAVILITICLDMSCDIVVLPFFANAIAWNPKRYDSYNLDKGPVFYEAYYPDIHDAYQRYLDGNMVLEKNFQVPSSDRLAYSAERMVWPTSRNKSFILMDEKNLSEEQRKMLEFRHNYETTNKPVLFHKQRSMILKDDKDLQTANIEKISKLVRGAFPEDLETWNALERYFDRANQDQLIPSQSGEYSKESKDKRSSYLFQPSRLGFDLSEQPILKLLQKFKAHDVKQQPRYFEKTHASGNTLVNKMSVSNTQVADIPINVISDSLPLENIFQSRPQFIKYIIFKKPMMRFDKEIEGLIDNSTPRNYDYNLIHEETPDSNHGRLVKENVKVTSIQVKELPRHKTRHHHGERLRDYSTHRHRLLSSYPTV